MFRNMSNYPTKDAEELAELFKALSNPHRLKIFVNLALCCRPGQACAPNMRACVGELGDGLELAPSTVSHHLKELRRVGLIHMKRAGQHVECWADPEALARAMIELGSDAGLRARMGAASRKIAQDKYDVHQVNAWLIDQIGL